MGRVEITRDQEGKPIEVCIRYTRAEEFRQVLAIVAFAALGVYLTTLGHLGTRIGALLIGVSVFGVYRLRRALVTHKGRDITEIATRDGIQTSLYYSGMLGTVPWCDIKFFSIEKTLHGDVLVANLNDPAQYESKLPANSIWDPRRPNAPPFVSVVGARLRLDVDALRGILDEMRRNAPNRK